MWDFTHTCNPIIIASRFSLVAHIMISFLLLFLPKSILEIFRIYAMHSCSSVSYLLFNFCNIFSDLANGTCELRILTAKRRGVFR